MRQISLLLLASAAYIATCSDVLDSTPNNLQARANSDLIRRAGPGPSGQDAQNGQKGQCWNLEPWEDLVVPWDADWKPEDLGYKDVQKASQQELEIPGTIDARNLDWSDVDQENGINITRLLKSRDLTDLDVETAHQHIERLIRRAIADGESYAEEEKESADESLLHVLQSRTNRLEARAADQFQSEENYRICNYGQPEKNPAENEMEYWCPKYLKADFAFDTYDPEDWKSVANVEIKWIPLNKRQPMKSSWISTPTQKNPKGDNRRYISEHNLEKQAFQHFFREHIEMNRKKTATGTLDALGEGGTSSLFQFQDETDAAGKVVKDKNGKPKKVPVRRPAPQGFESHFDDYCGFMKYFWSGYNVDGLDKKSPERPLNMVGNAWPNGPEEVKKAPGGTITAAAKGLTEMVAIQQQLNGIKAKLFGMSQMIDRKRMNGMVKPGKVASDTIQSFQDYLHHWRLSLLLISYMNHPDIKASYKKQADRVGEHLVKAEQKVIDFWDESKWDKTKKDDMAAAEKNKKIKSGVPKYESQDLSPKWKEYIKRFHGDVSERLYKWVEDQQPLLKKELIGLKKKYDAAVKATNAENDATKKKPLKEYEDKLAELHKGMMKIDEEVEKKISGSRADKRGLIANPFP